MSIRFSIIIPNFNSGTYLEEAILSIVNQNYKHLELIIIDGKSSDNSLEIIEKYNEKISYWISENDNGQTHALNKGIERARGEYIAYLNADDAYLGKSLQYIDGIIRKEKQPDLLFGDVRIGSEIAYSKILKNQVKNANLNLLIDFYLGNRFIIPSQSVFIKRDFLLKNNLVHLNENLHYCMDLDWYCMIKINNPRVFKYAEIISFFRINPGTKTSKNHKEMQLEASQIAFNYLPYLSPNKQKRFFYKRYLSRVLGSIYTKKIPFTLYVSFRIIMKSSGYSVLDRRYWGLIKQRIFA